MVGAPEGALSLGVIPRGLAFVSNRRNRDSTSSYLITAARVKTQYFAKMFEAVHPEIKSTTSFRGFALFA